MLKYIFLSLFITSRAFALPVTAIINASFKAEMASPMSGIIDKITVKEGDTFKKKSLLIAFKCYKQDAKLKKEKAILDKKSLIYDGYLRLRKLGAISKIELSEAKSEKLEAQALWKLAYYEQEDCKLFAPFDGQVTNLHIREFEYIDVGKPLINIVNFNELEIKIIAPSKWLQWIKPGLTFQVFVREINQGYRAKVVRYNKYIDSVSQTFSIFAKFIEKPINVTPGMSGEAIFKEAR